MQRGGSDRFRVLQVFRDSLTLLRRRGGLFFALAVIGTAPRLFWGWADLIDADPGAIGDDDFLWRSLVIDSGELFVRSLLFFCSQALVIIGVYRVASGQPASIRDSLRGLLDQVSAITRTSLALSVLDLLIFVACWAPMTSFLGEPWAEWVLDTTPWSFALLEYLIEVPFWVAMVVAVVEGPRALRRSWVLTRRNRLRIFLILVSFLAAWEVFATTMFETEIPASATQALWIGYAVVKMVATSVVVTVGYFALRREKEELGENELGEVFA